MAVGREFPGSVTCREVAAAIGPGLAKSAIAAEVDGQQRDLSAALPPSGAVNLRLFTKRDAESLAIMRHSCAHVMAQAVMRLHKGVQLAFGPTTGSGFYYDFRLPKPLTEEDFPKIEAEMAKIVKEDLAFERLDTPRDEATQLVSELGQQFKVEHIATGLGGEPRFVLSPRGVHRPLPRRACAQHRSHRQSVQTAEHCRRLLEG